MNATFTKRETQIAQLLCKTIKTDDGLTRRYTDAEIGERLGIAPSTVKVHTLSLRWKLGVERRGLIPKAWERRKAREAA